MKTIRKKIQKEIKFDRVSLTPSFHWLESKEIESSRQFLVSNTKEKLIHTKPWKGFAFGSQIKRALLSILISFSEAKKKKRLFVISLMPHIWLIRKLGKDKKMIENFLFIIQMKNSSSTNPYKIFLSESQLKRTLLITLDFIHFCLYSWRTQKKNLLRKLVVSDTNEHEPTQGFFVLVTKWKNS